MTCINATVNARSITPKGNGRIKVITSLNTTSNISRAGHEERIRDADDAAD